MADNIIQVNVTANKPKSVTVSSAQVGTEITASSDTGRFWAQTSKNWAVSDAIVDNTDYSSKYYANKAKESATNANNTFSSIRETYQDFQDESNIVLNELNSGKAEGLEQIDIAKNNAINDINITKTDIITDIEFVADGEKEEIRGLADEIKDNAEDIINRVGISMFDTILKDHVLTYEESKGLSLQGTYVYKDAVAGSRYGYPDFYNKVVEEYNNSTDEYITQEFVQPVLTSDGVMGGATFAVSSNVAQYDSDTSEVYKAFDNDSSGQFHSQSGVTTGYIDMYNPKPLNITSINITNQSSSSSANRASSAGIIYGSNNGEDWEEITTYTNTVQSISGTWSIDLSSNTKYFKYYRLESTAGGSASYWSVGEIDLVGTELVVTLKKNPNGHVFYDIANKDVIDSIFESTGTAWFYGVDTENERIFLPRNNYFDQATGDTTEVGQSVEAGLPNIEGSTYIQCTLNGGGQVIHDTGGALIAGHESGWSNRLGSGTWTAQDSLAFDASRSNSTYGNSDTVQPPAVKKLLYICVGNTETVSSVTDVVEVTTTENDTTPLFTGMYFDFIPNNVSWLKAGEQANNAGIYATCYNTLVNCLNGDNPYNIKVIEANDKVAGVDYSEYWVVAQDFMSFTTPTAISNKALSGAVKGNGMALGVTDGTNDYTLAQRFTSSTVAGSRAAFSTSQNPVNVGEKTPSGNYCAADNIVVGVSTDSSKSGIIAEQSTAQLYFKVANAVQNLELLDAGEVLEALADKISRQDCPAYITETYNNNGSWYRVYSDGWCEQGGVLSSNTNYEHRTVTFLKPFIDTNYTINFIGSGAENWGYTHGINAKTTNTVTLYNLFNTKGLGSWSACGYIN